MPPSLSRTEGGESPLPLPLAAPVPSSPPPASPARPSVRRTYFSFAPLDHLVSGLLAGTTTTLCLHPFDLLKTRMQVGTGTGAWAGSSAATATAAGSVAGVAGVAATPASAAAGAGANGGPYYRSSFHAARALVSQEGWLSLYKGLSPNLVGNTLAWGLYFGGFDIVKRHMSEREPMAIVRMLSQPAHLPTDPHTHMHASYSSSTAARGHRPRRPLNALEHILAAALTGACVSALTNPIWVVKTRMFTDRTPRGAMHVSGATGAAAAAAAAAAASVASSDPFFTPPRLLSALRHLYLTEGLAGLYRGFLPGLFGVSQGALQFMCYEELKRIRLHQRHMDASELGGGSMESRLRQGGGGGGGSGSGVSTTVDPTHAAAAQWSAPETIAMSVLSKAFSSLCTYPYQTIRSRMQAARGAHPTLRHVVAATWREEGVRGFYRGVGINLLRVMPAACSVFLVYEQVGGYFKRHATYEQH